MTEEHRDSPYLYLTTTGWKTGNPHQIEIWYVAHKGHYYLVAETRDKAHWVQNIRYHPAVSVRVEGQTFEAIGRVVDPVREPELATEIRALMDVKYDWSDGVIVELSPST